MARPHSHTPESQGLLHQRSHKEGKTSGVQAAGLTADVFRLTIAVAAADEAATVA